MGKGLPGMPLAETRYWLKTWIMTALLKAVILLTLNLIQELEDRMWIVSASSSKLVLKF